MLEGSIQAWDDRRDLYIAADADEAIAFAAQHWIHSAERAIQQRGRFAVALSGGSTPKAIYEKLAREHRSSIDWQKIWLFWSDERPVSPEHPDSNYRMAMQSLQTLSIPPSQVFRMKAETDIEKHAAEYADTIQRKVGPHLFDLVMLGVGEDGHTASLFPKTAALLEQGKLVAANYITEKNQWRMTFTYPCILKSTQAVVYAIGENKQAILPLVLRAAIKSSFPASAIGTTERKALWIVDRSAARLL